MFVPESTQNPGVLHSGTPDAVRHTTPPVGGYGAVTTVGAGEAVFLVCKTERGRRGWGVHDAAGALLVSGWPTRARAVAYAKRQASRTLGGAA